MYTTCTGQSHKLDGNLYMHGVLEQVKLDAYAVFLALATRKTIHCTTAAVKATDAIRYLHVQVLIHPGNPVIKLGAGCGLKQLSRTRRTHMLGVDQHQQEQQQRLQRKQMRK